MSYNKVVSGHTVHPVIRRQMRHYATPERGIMGFMPPVRAAVTARGSEGA
jgi:hypothetical protein